MENLDMERPEEQSEAAVQPVPEVQEEATAPEAPVAEVTEEICEEAAAESCAEAEEKEERKCRRKKMAFCVIRTAVATLLILALVAGSCCATVWYLNGQWEKERNNADYQLNKMNLQIAELKKQIEDNSFTGNGNSISGTTTAPGEALTAAQVYAQNYKSVVAISGVIKSSSYGQSSYGTTAGSGFIISTNGYVVTNSHLVQDATNLMVILYDGTEVPAELVGYDAANDVAVLKADLQNQQAVTLGSSDDLIVGDQVVAIGYPLGEMASATLTVGYISGKDRTVSFESSNINMLQTDAAINSGSSGGPLFNMKGEVVGITSAKMSGTSSSGAIIESTSYAIPIDDVRKKINDLSVYGYVTGAYLGVSVQDMSKSEADRYGLPMGAYVAEVVDGYCAKEAGVQAKDIIVELGGQVVTGVNTLTRALEQLNPGDTTTIVVCRSGIYVTLDITLSEKPIS